MQQLAIEPVIQRSTGDCGICCVATLTDLSYREVYAQAKKVVANPDEGLCLTDLKHLVRLCRRRCTYLRQWQPEEQDGILAFVPAKHPRRAGGHWAVLFNGSLYNPADGLLYRYEAYLASKPQLKPVGLLVVE